MPTNVPRPTFGPTGFVAPLESTILAGVQQDINAAFGGNLDPDLSTPQGQLASSEAAIIGDKNDQFLQYVNQVDPAFAEGRMQDAIGRIYFIERNPAQPTVTQVACVGLPNVPIPVGALLQASDGNLYICTGGGTIPLGGTITLPFACAVTGPIACPAQQFTIYRTIPGWDTAISSSDGALGNNVESRADFETRRRLSVAMNGQGSPQAVLGAVLSVSNVLDAYVYDNTSQSPVTIGGVTIPGNCLYVAAAGGAAADIANAIWVKKSPGCNTTGTTAQTIYDSSYSVPQPSYVINFTVPTAIPILFSVSIANSTIVPSNALTLIQNAIVSAFSGGDGGPRARIGSTVFASRYYGAVAALGSWAQIVSLKVGTSVANLDSVTMHIDQIPTIAAGNISLTLV